MYDLRGRLVAELRPRQGRLFWDGTDRRGGEAASGLYFCRVGPVWYRLVKFRP